MSSIFSSPQVAPPPPPMPDIQEAQRRIREQENMLYKPRARASTLITQQKGGASTPQTQTGDTLNASGLNTGTKTLLGQ